jgi:hypothetical protein
MFSEIKLLARQIETSFSGSTTEVSTFSSGSVILDVRWRGRLFVMVHSPAGEFGVDEVGEREGFDTGTSSYRIVSMKPQKSCTGCYKMNHRRHIEIVHIARSISTFVIGEGGLSAN